VAYATLEALARKGKISAMQLLDAAKQLDIDPNKPAPTQSLGPEARAIDIARRPIKFHRVCATDV
jgi:hypothetical protein